MNNARIRSDQTLRLLLEKIKVLGGSDHVHQFLDDCLRHMGDKSPYLGGQELVSLLRHAHVASRQDNDDTTADRIEDALAYAMRTTLRPDIQTNYQIFPGSRTSHHKLVRDMIRMAYAAAAERARFFLEENPEGTGEAVMKHLKYVAENADDIIESPDTSGIFLLRSGPELHSWFSDILANRLRVELMKSSDQGGGLHTVLSGNASLAEIASLGQLRIRRAALDELASVVSNSNSSEFDLQREIARNLWIFGGTYAPRIGPRRLADGIELDIPLVRYDGSLHVVELKRANIRIMTHHRNGLIPNSEVHRAVGQVMNYLVALDEDRHKIAEDYGVDVRRATATVVVGHPRYEPNVEEAALDGVLRTYNSHLARVHVTTYKQLLDSATRSLGLEAEALSPAIVEPTGAG